MSRSPKHQPRSEHDYYRTPVAVVSDFLNVAQTRIPQFLHGNVLDPCCGGDRDRLPPYPIALVAAGVERAKILTIDLREDSPADIHANYLEWETSRRFDLIISNPPFNFAVPFIRKAINELAPNGHLALLLRLNFLASQQRLALWRDLPPSWVFVHPRRISFLESGRTDSTEYAHFVWRADRKGPTTIEVIQPPQRQLFTGAA